MHRRRSPRQGFTLIEISVVIVLIGAIIGTLSVVFAYMLKQHQQQETETKLQAIQSALYGYRIAFNTLPCPADITLPISDNNFGAAASNAGSCTGGVPAANFSGSDGTDQEPRGGMVPTQALRLPDDYAFDGWGRRMMYFVTKDLTLPGAFNLVAGYDSTTRMTIKNSQGTDDTQLAAYVIVSFGSNGHGAYPRKGGATRVISGSVNTDELDNCDCNTATAAPTGLDGIFVQKSATLNPSDALDSFDDIVVYATRVDMVLQSSMAWSLGPEYTFKVGGGGGLPGYRGRGMPIF